MDIHGAVEEYVSKKVSSLAKFLQKSDDVLCEVEIGKETNSHKSGDMYKAEINVTYMGRQYYVVGENEDVYFAIDKMRDEIERVIVSKNKRYKTLFRHGASKIKNLVKRLYK